MSDQTCLKRHLLYASVQAYHPHTPGYSSAPPRWHEPPVEIEAPPIDFALVGRFAEGVVIAFRGTLPPLDLTADGKTIVAPEFTRWPAVIQDWLNNLNTLPKADVPGGGRPALPGRVHPGFAASLDRLWPGIVAAVDRLIDGEQAPRLYFTGHSKGGAVANLAALCARRHRPEAIVKVATFGAPHAGDEPFAEAYRASGIDCQRYEVADDVVPKIPPGASAVGEGHGVATITFPPPLSRLLSLGRVFVRDDRGVLPLRIAAHMPYHDFGYDKHVYEAGAQPEWS
jgi:Lipase (class 3)